MLRTFVICCILIMATATLASAGGAKADSKRILGKWLSSRHGAASIFHADGSWGVQRDLDHETIQGRWWIKDNKLFLTYPEDNGVGTPIHIRTAEYVITFESDDRFITDTQGHKEIYERFR
jgi:hypothetical protein